MSLLTDFWEKWTADVNTPLPPDQTAATDLLQIDAPTLTDREGDAWFVAVATTYNRLGIISQPTYVQLRAEVNQTGEAGSNDLFDALQGRIVSLAETRVVVAALDLEALTREFEAIDGNISTIERNKTETTDRTLIVAYNEGIRVLQQRQSDLKDILAQRTTSRL